MIKRMLLLALLFVGVTACASAGSTSSSEGPSRDRNILTAEAIAAAPDRLQNAYDVVHGLRPNWLRARAGGTIANPGAGQVVVYLDGRRHGSVETLRGFRRQEIVSLQYMSPADATTRFGTDVSGGVILVTTRVTR